MSRGASKHSRCTHEPVTELKEFVRSTTIMPGKVGFSYWSENEWFCAKCKRRLIARWYPKENTL